MVSFRDEERAVPCFCCVVDRTLLVLSGLASVGLVGWALYFSHYGLDITDEGFYLTWLTQTFGFSSFISQFGFIYRPLYLLAGEDLVRLRQINVLLTYGLGVGLAYALMERLTPLFPRPGWGRLVVAAGYGSAALLALVIAGSWLPTPSYNTLATQSLLLAAIGLCLAKADFTRLSVLGWILIGVGAWLAFMAKPTTAAVLAVCVTAYLLLGGVMRVRLVLGLLALTAILLLASSYVVDGGTFESVERIRRGMFMSQLLGGGHTAAGIWRLEAWPLNNAERQWWFGLTMFLWLWCFCASTRYKVPTLVSLVVVVAAMALIFAVIFYSPSLHINIGQFQHLLILAIPLAGVLYAIVLLPCWGRGLELWRACLLAVFLAVLPFAYVFGTGNMYWQAMEAASVFWVMTGLAAMSITIRRRQNVAALLVMAIATQVFVTLSLHTSLEKPYRQPQPLFLNDYSLSIGNGGSSVIVEEAYGKYLQAAQEAVKSAGFIRGTPMIDLTGQSPGLLHLFGAKSVGQPWMLGGYPGSDQFVTESLRRVDCSVLAEAWLLVEPDGPISISTEVLQAFGADIQDYTLVGSWQTSPGAGGFQQVRTQNAYKPMQPAPWLEKRCEGLIR